MEEKGREGRDFNGGEGKERKGREDKKSYFNQIYV